MASFGRKACKILFTIICITVVVCMICYWIYKYEVEDRDIGVVDYALLKEIPENIKMPVVSLCLRDPFLQYKLSKINDSIDTTAYKDYLKGDLNDSALDQIDYKNVILHLKDYFTNVQELWVNESVYRNNSHFVDHKVVFDGFYREENFLRCFMLKSEIETHLESIVLYYDMQKLDHEWGNHVNLPLIYLKVHYPGQFLLGDNPLLVKYPLSISPNATYYQIKIDEVEILKRRPSRKKACLTDVDHYDSKILLEHIHRKGCCDIFLDNPEHFPRCMTEEKIRENLFQFGSATTLGIPYACQRMSKVSYTLSYQPFYPVQSGKWAIVVYYPKEFRIVTQSKEVDIHTLIGNIGGYLGLFMGNFIFKICKYRNLI